MSSLAESPDELFLAALAAGQLPYTGRQIITFRQDATAAEMAGALVDLGPMAAASDFAGHAVDFAQADTAATLLFENLGAAILSPGNAAIGAAAVGALAAAPNAIDRIDPETFAYAIGLPASAAAQNAQNTWAIDAVRASQSAYTGLGIRVAVLDTGMDLAHPDFAGRAIVSNSFVPGEQVQDLHGHGTHCIGTSCGPRAVAGMPRYGIASGATIYAGKVLANSGTGSTGGILAGINWAIANGCHIISMSLGAPTPPQPFYQQAAQRALAAGCLIVAAAGNGSRRPQYIDPTGSPANSQDMVSVAAIDAALQVAVFSSGNKVEISGPGVDIFSTAPMPRRYATMSGTSMATPHVAGVAALWAESNPALRGAALLAALQAHASPLALPVGDVGSGLVQAP